VSLAPTLAAAAVKTLPDISIGHSLVQMVIALVVIVVCIWGLGKGLARMRGSAASPRRKTAGSGLQVVSRQSLGKDLSIATVRWGEREILVGIAGSTITFLNDPRADDTAHGPATALPAEPSAESAAAATALAMFSAAALTSPAPRAAAPADREPAMSSSGAIGAVGADGGRPASLLDTLRNATLRR